MGATAAVHPSDQTLHSYGLGKLDLVSAESVKKHLEGCAACRSRIAEMTDDSLLDRLGEEQRQARLDRPVVSSLAGLSMLDVGPSSTAPPRPARCPRDWPITRITRSSASSARGAWGRSTWPRTGSWAGTKS